MKTFEQKCALLLEVITHAYELGSVRDDYMSQLQKHKIDSEYLKYAFFIFDQIEEAKPSNYPNRSDIHVDFEDWIEDALMEEPSVTYAPYSDPIHEICWMVWYALAIENGPSNL